MQTNVHKILDHSTTGGHVEPYLGSVSEAIMMSTVIRPGETLCALLHAFTVVSCSAVLVLVLASRWQHCTFGSAAPECLTAQWTSTFYLQLISMHLVQAEVNVGYVA